MEDRKHCFTDLENREWEVSITVGVIRKVRQKLSIDLADAFEIDSKGQLKTKVLGQIAADPVLLIDVLYCICEEQANARNVSDTAFGELFSTGEMIEDACNAFMYGLMRFLPPAKRLVMERVLQIANRNLKEVQDKAKAALEDPQMQEEISKIWKEQFLNTPES